MKQTQLTRANSAILNLLGEIERMRELSPDERVLMERTFRQVRKREVWRWKAKDDRRLEEVIARRAKTGQPKPFERNDEIKKLAEELGRTYFAVHRRMERLRKRRKCSDAKRKGRG